MNMLLCMGHEFMKLHFFCHIIHNIAKHMPYFLPIQYHCSHMNTIPNIKRPKPNLRYPVIHIKKLAYSIQPPVNDRIPYLQENPMSSISSLTRASSLNRLSSSVNSSSLSSSSTKPASCAAAISSSSSWRRKK